MACAFNTCLWGTFPPPVLIGLPSLAYSEVRIEIGTLALASTGIRVGNSTAGMVDACGYLLVVPTLTCWSPTDCILCSVDVTQEVIGPIGLLPIESDDSSSYISDYSSGADFIISDVISQKSEHSSLYRLSDLELGWSDETGQVCFASLGEALCLAVDVFQI